MKTKLEVKRILENKKPILLIKSNVKAGPPMIVRRGD